jgi:hypothetical protein
MGSNRTAIVILIALILFLVVNEMLILTNKMDVSRESFWTGLGIMIGAGLTLAMYSFLYKDNPVFKFAEHLYIGVSVGYFILIAVYDTLMPNLFIPLFSPAKGSAPDLWLIIPFALGVLMFSRFTPKQAWLSRWSIAFIVGYGAGTAIPNIIKANILMQAKSSMVQVTDWAQTTCMIIALIGVITVLLYFFFSLEHKGVVGKISRVGVIFLMISFGASFAYTVMARISLLIGRVNFLLKDWLHVIK